jgi:plastocyanin
LTAALLCSGAGRTVWAARMPVRVLDQDGQPVADAVVFVESATGTFKAPEEPYIMDQVNKEFVPHVLPIVAGGRVRFPNDDNIHHQIYSFSPAKTFELPLYRGEPAEPVDFPKVGVVKLGCNIHDWMSGIILVLPNPYFAKTGVDGTAILELPEGTSPVSVFHARLKGSQEATRREVAPEPGKTLVWKLVLRPERGKKRPAQY